MPAVGDLVRCTKGSWMIRPPQHCPLGHRLTPGRVMAAVIAALLMNIAAANATQARAAGAITYTVEPLDLDGVYGTVHTVTQAQLHGSLCPCVKVPYIADALHNQDAVDNIDKLMKNGTIKPGDTVAGFSLGAQNISQYLATHKPTPGVRFVLLGDTFWRNDQFAALGWQIPYDIANQVILVANQYDGWSDQPDKVASPDYRMAQQNATTGQGRVHNYVNARLDHPANVVTTRGNITSILIPTQKLPLDAQQRAQIDDAYSRPGPTPEQLAAATDEQVSVPPAPIHETPEPVADL